MSETGVTKSYHAHLYYDADTLEVAKEVAERVSAKFDLEIGTFHEKNVGPHPMWSCQISIEKGKFGRVIPWLMKNRSGLTVFVHPETGDFMKDHTDHAIWMGRQQILNLEAYSKGLGE